MTKNNNTNSSYNMCDTSNYCNNLANQFNFLATIYTAIISQEIEDDEVLGLLGSFFNSTWRTSFLCIRNSYFL